MDLIDKNGVLTGEKESRDNIHRLGLLHHASGLVILGGGGILAQQRALSKEKNAGLWDISASGHIDAGESPIESLMREVHEELGLKIDKKDIFLLGKYWRHEKYSEKFIENELDYIYVLIKDVKISDIKIQEQEVERVEWFSFSEFAKMIQDGKVVKRPFWDELICKYKNNKIT